MRPLHEIGASDYRPTEADITTARATAQHFRTWADTYPSTPEAARARGAADVADATADRMERTR